MNENENTNREEPSDPHGYFPIFRGFIAATALALWIVGVGAIAWTIAWATQ